MFRSYLRWRQTPAQHLEQVHSLVLNKINAVVTARLRELLAIFEGRTQWTFGEVGAIGSIAAAVTTPVSIPAPPSPAMHVLSDYLVTGVFERLKVIDDGNEQLNLQIMALTYVQQKVSARPGVWACVLFVKTQCGACDDRLDSRHVCILPRWTSVPAGAYHDQRGHAVFGAF